jgi:hypothetical protein
MTSAYWGSLGSSERSDLDQMLIAQIHGTYVHTRGIFGVLMMCHRLVLRRKRLSGMWPGGVSGGLMIGNALKFLGIVDLTKILPILLKQVSVQHTWLAVILKLETCLQLSILFEVFEACLAISIQVRA